VRVCVYINILVALWLSPSHRPLACPLARSLSLIHSHSPNLSLPFSPSTVSSSGEEPHSRFSSLSPSLPLLLERALIFFSFSLLDRLNRKKLLLRKMMRIPWSGCDDTDWSLDCEMTMPLRAPSKLSDSLHMYSSCLRSTMDSMRMMMFFLLLPFFLFSGCFLLLNFWLFFWVVFTNYVREPRKELYSSPSGCMSKPGKRRGNRGPSNSGFNIGRCGWKKKDTKRESLVSHKYKYEELFVRILIDTEFFHGFGLRRKKKGRGRHVLCVVLARDPIFLVFLTPCTRNAQVGPRWRTEGRDPSILPRDKRDAHFFFLERGDLSQTLVTGEY